MKKLMLTMLLLLLPVRQSEAKCVGKMINPITGPCWKCLFPIRVAGFKVVKGDDTKPQKKRICICDSKDSLPLSPGLPISFFEPARLVEVTRTPGCLVSLGGQKH